MDGTISIKNIAYADVSNIDFTPHQALKKKFDKSLACLDDQYTNELFSITNNNKEDNVKESLQENVFQILQQTTE